MPKQVQFKKGNNGYRSSIVSLLQSEKLPAADLPSTLDDFIIAVDEENVVGAIGLEKYHPYALLRSLVVNKNYRNEKIAERLLSRLEEGAAQSGIECIYLLTETAPDYFKRKGYKTIGREEVPVSVNKSSEFSHVCPQSAIVMKKQIV